MSKIIIFCPSVEALRVMETIYTELDYEYKVEKGKGTFSITVELPEVKRENSEGPR